MFVGSTCNQIDRLRHLRCEKADHDYSHIYVHTLLRHKPSLSHQHRLVAEAGNENWLRAEQTAAVSTPTSLPECPQPPAIEWPAPAACVAQPESKRLGDAYPLSTCFHDMTHTTSALCTGAAASQQGMLLMAYALTRVRWCVSGVCACECVNVLACVLACKHPALLKP